MNDQKILKFIFDKVILEIDHGSSVINDCDNTNILKHLRVQGLITDEQHQEVISFVTFSDRNRAMISLVAKEIHDSIAKFHMLCKTFLCEHYYNELAENMQLVFCVLKCEKDILQQQNCQEIFCSLKEIKFLDDDEEKMVLESSNKIEVIMNVLMTKCLHCISTFFLCLKKLPNCSILVHKIENEITSLNFNLYLRILPPSLANEFSVVNACTGYMRNTPLHDLYEYFKKVYISSSSTITGVLDPPNVFYVNLTLNTIGEDDKDHDFHDDSWLFKQESTYSRRSLTSLSQIFIEDQQKLRVILIQGSPGSGKTTLAKKICRDWVEGELLENFTHIILVELRGTRVAEVTSIKELIALYMGDSLGDSIAKEIIRIQGKGIMFLLEGWDELPESNRHSTLFTDLISGKLLPDAMIVITSRPSASGSLPYEWIDRRLEILGFTPAQVEEYTTKYFKGHDNSSHIVEHVLSQLKSSPCLKRLILVPINLSIVLFIFKQNNQQIPQSYTALYENFLLILLNRYREKTSYNSTEIASLKHLPDCIHNVLLNLAKMAYYELLQDKITFTDEIVQQNCFASSKIPEDFDGMGLLHVNNRVYATHVSKTYHFIHRTLQELLAAWYLSQQSIPFQRKQLLLLFNQKKLQLQMHMVWIFYGGLTRFEDIPFDTFFRNSITQLFKTYIYKCLSDVIHYSLNKKIIRFPGINEILATYFATQQYSKNISNYVSREFQTTLMAVALEVESPSFCKIICNSYLFNDYTCWFTVPDSAVTPQILLALSYCISHSEKKWIIFCKALDNKGPNSLLQHLNCTIENCEHKTCHHHNCIRMIDVFSGPDQIDGLIRIIHHQNSLEYIILSQSMHLNDSCILKLAEALRNNTCVKLLHLLGCNLTAIGTQAIADMLKFNSTLEWIGLRDNRDSLKEEDIILLMDSIYHHNSTLYMLMLDSKFHERLKVKSCLQKINDKRQLDNKQNLCLTIIDCGRYSNFCRRFVTIQ